MTENMWLQFVLPIATALLGWLGSAYRNKQKKENDRQPYNILGKDEGGRPYFGRLEIVINIRAIEY